MKLIKANWILHQDEKTRPGTIFSCDVHPDSTRLATGGLDTKIKVWSTAKILDEEKERDETVSKLLCTMTSHSGVVMCVRWSNNGTYLASGSDDNVIMVWSLDAGVGGKVWGSTETNVENWKAAKRLVGHASDVAGVAWNSDDSYLASVGLDSTVFVWSGSTFECVQKLNGHQGFVKGVVWDPVGQYLATQSDDNSLKIWRTTDWQLEKSIEAPFKNSPCTTITRLSWSPEGAYIVTPNSMNGPVFVASVIDRKSWTSNNSMVGHENVVEVVLFNPLIFLRDAKAPPTNSNLCTLLAIAARNSISIWFTSSSHPFVVFDEVFDRDILDMSWSADGMSLWACSSDGHVVVFTFDPSEFNTVAPAGTKETFYNSYGFQPRPTFSSTSALSSHLPGMTSIGTLAQPNILQSRKGPGAKRIVAPRPPVIAQPLVSQQQQHQQQQQPLASNPFTPALQQPPQHQHQQQHQLALQSQYQPQQHFPQSQQYGHPQPPPHPHQSQSHDQGQRMSYHGERTHQQPIFHAPNMSYQQQQYYQQQQQYSTQQYSSLGNPPNHLQLQSSQQIEGTRQASIDASTSARKRKADHLEEPPSPASNGPAARISDASYRGVGHLLGDDLPNRGRTDDNEEDRRREIRPAYLVQERKARFRITNNPSASNDDVEDSRTERYLAVPAVMSMATFLVEDGDGDELVWRNLSEGDRVGTAEVAVVQDDRTLWIDYLPRYVVCGTGSEKFAAVSTEDGALNVYSPTGRRLLPTMILDSPCSLLEAEGDYLMAITALGSITVWDTKIRKSLFPPLNISTLLLSTSTPSEPIPAITTSSILSNGSPLIALSSGATHSFDANLNTWIRLSDQWWSTGSEFWEGRRHKGKSGAGTPNGNGVVRAVEGAINEIVVDRKSKVVSDDDDDTDDDDEDDEPDDDENENGVKVIAAGDKDAGTKTGAKGKGIAEKWKEKVDPDQPSSKRQKPNSAAPSNPSPTKTRSKKQKAILPAGEFNSPLGSSSSFVTAMSLGHLEERMHAAIAVGSKTEYRIALTTYCKRLSEEGLKSKCEELIGDLMGRVFHNPNLVDTWSPTVLGFNKRDLLKDMLTIFAKSKILNKMAVENQDLLKKLSSS